MRKLTISSTIFVWLLSATAHGFLLGDPGNGKLVHQDKCAACHIDRFGGDGSEIYLRKDRRIKTVEGLMAQVEFCDRQIKSGLKDDQLDDLVIYLNENYYNFE